jgi:hypothetical protein
MMKSKQSLKNSAKPGLLKICIVLSILVSGCTTSTAPTYLKEDISQAIQDICKDEYKLDVAPRLVGQTLWIYIPVEGLFIKDDKPEKYTEKFSIDQNNVRFNNASLISEYLIKTIPEEEKYQEYKYNKEVLKKINNVWVALRRVMFSMERQRENEPKFFYLIVADIKNGFEIKELSYYLDLKKVSYDFISASEYQHRLPQDVDINPRIIGDKEGMHIAYKDISLEEFIASQIQHRIKLKFQKPEVDKNADIDKEIAKIIVYTVKTYEFKNFSEVELANLFTRNKTVLNQAAVWARPIE